MIFVCGMDMENRIAFKHCFISILGVTICSMAIGSGVNMAEINGMSSPGCVYKAKTFRSYKRIMQYAFKSRGAGAAAPVLDPGFFKGIKF